MSDFDIVPIPVGRIWNLVSGRAWRRFWAEVELQKMWAQATPTEREQVLKELARIPDAHSFYMKLIEIDQEVRAHERNIEGARKLRAWLRRHPIIRRCFVGILAVAAPYLFLSRNQRWIMSVGQYRDESAPHPG